MKSLTQCLAGAAVSSFVAVSASAVAADPLVAPQLSLAGSGPVGVTFLGASQPYGQLAVVTPSGLTGFFFGFDSPAAGDGFQTTLTGPSGTALPAGSALTFAATFTDPNGTRQWSTTGASPFVAADLASPSAGVPASLVMQNGTVFDDGSGRLLIGFNPSGSAAGGFGSYAVRIAVSNVCAR